MAKFLYLYRYDAATLESKSPEQMQQIMKKWMDWMETLQKDGNLHARGERLQGLGKVVRGKAKAVTDGPFAEVKDQVGGYTIVEAKDMDQALKLSKGCPIFENDGDVEIRSILSI